MTVRYFDRDGSPIPMLTWARKLEDRDYCRVARTTVREGVDVSTVWLGLNHRWDDGAPLIFETMVFRAGHGRDYQRYSTLAEAQAGHEVAVLAVQMEAP